MTEQILETVKGFGCERYRCAICHVGFFKVMINDLGEIRIACCNCDKFEKIGRYI